MKKTLTLILAFVMVVSLFVGSAFAAGLTIAAGSASADELNETVTVDITMSGNSGDLACLRFILGFDASKLEMTDLTVNSTFANDGMANVNKTGASVAFVANDTTNYNGTIATATFKVLAEGTHAVTVTIDQCFDGNDENLAAASVSGSVTLDLPQAHEHSYTGEYKYDETGHWQLCECGEAGAVEAHDMVEGICSVCGYEEEVVDPDPDPEPEPDPDPDPDPDPEPTVKPTTQPSTGTDKSPQTGDDSAILLWAGMLTICAAAVAVIVASKKRKTSK